MYYFFIPCVSQPLIFKMDGCSNRTRFARLVAYAVLQK